MSDRYQKKIKAAIEARPGQLCSPEGFCGTMSVYVQRDRKKGLSVVEYFTLDGRRRSPVVYRATANDSGIILNRCPWCGEQLHADAGEA